MPLPNLLLPPDQANYTHKFGDQIIATQLDGGASRFRRDQLGAAFQLEVQWTCNDKNYDYVTAFYRTSINFGSDPFTCSLILDQHGLQSYTCHFLPGTFRLDSQQGQTYVLRATLEVLPDPSYYTNDSTIIAAGPDV